MKTGKICAKHPELAGLRSNNRQCLECRREYDRRRDATEKRKARDRGEAGYWKRLKAKKKRQQLTEHRKKYILLEWMEKLAA